VVVASAAIALVAGCTSDVREADTARDAAVYRSVIVDLVDRSAVVLDDSETLPVLFVEGLASGVPLEVQVEVVADFAEQYEVRFIDELEEAIEVDTIGRPVRSNSLLIGLGPVVGDRTASLRGELYVRDREAQAYGYELTSIGGGSWAIVGEPEPIAPEGFAVDP
jgi:hypothetical protein